MNTPPKTYAATFFAFLDILGFKDMVFGYSHEGLVNVYYGPIVSNIGLSVANGKIKTIELKNGEKRVVPDSDAYLVNSILISDSVILWTENDSMQSFLNLLAAVRVLLAANLACNLPMRGAIAHGPLTFQSFTEQTKLHNSHQILVGKALVDAYLAEREAEWMGCIIGDSCIEKYRHEVEIHRSTMPDIAELDYLRRANFLTEFDVPFRKNRVEKHWVVNWPYGSRGRLSDEAVRKAFAGHHKKTDDERVKQKIENTIRFLNAVRPKAGDSNL